MKKLLFALLILAAMSARAQLYQFPIITIWSIDKDTVFAGDSLTVYFKYTNPTATPWITGKMTLFPNIGNPPGLTFVVFDRPHTEYPSYPTVSDGGTGRLYVWRAKIPDTAVPGNARIYPSNPNPENYATLYIKARTVSSIKKNYTPDDVQGVTYYTLGGQELSEPSPGVTCVKVTLYKDGNFESKQVVNTGY